MILVDTALKARAAANNPIRVGLIGAGFMVQGMKFNGLREKVGMICDTTPNAGSAMMYTSG